MAETVWEIIPGREFYQENEKTTSPSENRTIYKGSKMHRPSICTYWGW